MNGDSRASPATRGPQEPRADFDAQPSGPCDLSHEEAIDALCGCAATVTVLSYQEAIEGYFALRGLAIPT
jgi:hypothetical protein